MMQTPKPERRRVFMALLVALLAAFYGVCGLLYFFHFRDQINEWWDSRYPHHQVQRRSGELRRAEQTIGVEEFVE